MKMRAVALAILGLWAFGRAAANEPTVIPAIENMSQIARELKLTRFVHDRFPKRVKIAILDNGFNGVQHEIGNTLPTGTTYHNDKPSAADKITDTSYHGLFMAELLAKVIQTTGANLDYSLDLYNAYGYTKFADAVEKVIQRRYDIVLYSQVWEYGGNGDGKGFIDTLVDKAVSAGVIWINAAGNFGLHMRKVPVRGKSIDGAKWALFQGGAAGVKIVCKAHKGQTCPLRLVLAWNDFKDDPTLGTDKDLDLFLLDRNDLVVATSERRQMLSLLPGDDDASQIPRELIEKNITPGAYEARVKMVSHNFSPARDRLRITATGTGIVLEKPDRDDTLLPPADDAGVITVGAADDPDTSRSRKAKKPDVSFFSTVILKDKTSIYGTSTAASMAAAMAALYIGMGTPADRSHVLAKLKTLAQPARGRPRLVRRVHSRRDEPTDERRVRPRWWQEPVPVPYGVPPPFPPPFDGLN